MPRTHRTALEAALTAALVLVLLVPAARAGGGACCLEDGSCLPAANEAECAAAAGIFLAGADCAFDACGVGACCDVDSGSCVEFPAYPCIAGGREFGGAGTTCIDDPCGIDFGACCFAGGTCAGLSAAECDGQGGTWQGAGTDCEDGLCVLGACCFTGFCEDLVAFECAAVGGAFVPDEECVEGGCNVEFNCPLDSLYAQPRGEGPSGDAFTSEGAAGFKRFDNFSGAAGAIDEITWWGFDLAFEAPNFSECVETDNSFLISFHTNAGGQPGAVVCAEVLVAERIPTGILFEGPTLIAELNEYRVTLPVPCVLVDGWLSIQGLGDPDCWFLWLSTSAGDGISFCEGCQNELQPADMSFCLSGPIGGVFGACCNLSTGDCADDVEIDECLEPGLRFVPGETCLDLDPPCFITPGACCFPDDGTCFISLADSCAEQGGTWLGADSSCDFCPVFGACCQGDNCFIFTEAECNEPGFIWLGEDTTCDECPSVPTCEEGSLFAQDPDEPDNEAFLAGTSESSTPFRRFDDFSGVAGPVDALTWWGLDLEFVPPVFVECEETDPTFEISFHEDAGGMPGDPVCSYTLLASREPLLLSYNGAQLNEYRVTLPEPCVMTGGWVSIVGLGDADCWFLWMSAGPGLSWCEGCISPPQGANFAVCLEGTVGGVAGACCDDSAGSCADGVDIADCAASGLRFDPGGTCAGLDPPCGEVEGACCLGLERCEIVTAVECAALEGVFLGHLTNCTQCPCLTPCPDGGVQENEPVCDEKYVDVLNGGCVAEDPAFLPVEVGQTVCGEGGRVAKGTPPDLDWYVVEIDGPVVLNWSAVAEFRPQIWIIDASRGCPGNILASDEALACEAVSVSAEVGAGTYWLVVAAAGADEAPCGTRYWATSGVAPICTGDTNGDAIVDVDDLVNVILAWGTANPAADVNDDGIVNVDDLVAVILAWGACPTAAAGAAQSGFSRLDAPALAPEPEPGAAFGGRRVELGERW